MVLRYVGNIEEDGVCRTQHLFFAHMQHLAGNVTGGADATDAGRFCPSCTTVEGAEMALHQVCSGMFCGRADRRGTSHSPSILRSRSSALMRWTRTTRPPSSPRRTTTTATLASLPSPQ